jgi:hypothetical protein
MPTPKANKQHFYDVLAWPLRREFSDIDDLSALADMEDRTARHYKSAATD